MSGSTFTRDPIKATRTNGSAGSARPSDVHWAAAAQTPGFRELVRRPRRFIVPATLFLLTWYFGLILLAGYAPGFMGEQFLADGLTVGYALALSLCAMVWGLAWWYLRKADREFAPLAPLDEAPTTRDPTVR